MHRKLGQLFLLLPRFLRATRPSSSASDSAPERQENEPELTSHFLSSGPKTGGGMRLRDVRLVGRRDLRPLIDIGIVIIKALKSAGLIARR